MISCPAPMSRLRRPSVIPCPTLSWLWRPSVISCPAPMSRLWRPSVIPCPATAMEAVCDFLSCPYVTAMEAVCDFLSCPVTAMEAACDSQTCPATAPETRKALPVLSVSALPVLSVSALSVLSVSVPPRSQTLPWFPAWSAFVRWSPASVWWSTAQVWWSSAPPWWSSARVWWSSAPPWWSSTPVWWFPVPPAPPWWALVPSAPPWWALVPSAPPWWALVPSVPPWWAPVPSSLPWLPALPQFPASPLAHGPGPPSLPLFRLHSTTLLDRMRASGSRSLGGAMSRILAMNFRPIATRGHLCITLTLTPHYCCHSPLNCISHHPLHRHSCSHGSRTHLRTISQSPSPNHTDFISLGLPLG